VGAAKRHLKSKFIANRDIEDFFGSISRSKLNRALIKVGIPRIQSFDIAYTSSVINQVGRPVLPYGFVQSMALASLVLDTSAVGAALRSANEYGVLVTVYVDDIIISSQEKQSLVGFLIKLDAAAAVSNFAFASHKCSPPSDEVTNFNCRIGSKVFQITNERMAQFRDQFKNCSNLGREAILAYVGAVNEQQKNELALFGEP
jgi:Reverse transcriptase (RNA-dependent DNA polymerase)